MDVVLCVCGWPAIGVGIGERPASTSVRLRCRRVACRPTTLTAKPDDIPP